MGRNYQIREYREEDRKKVITLYEEVFARKDAARFERRWKWEFLDNPAKNKVFCNNWVIELEGQIIGHLGSRPALLKVNEEVFPCLWAVDLMVHTNHRGKGLAKKLYEKFESAETFGNFMIGLGVPTLRIAQKRGWQECRADVVSIKILNLKGIKRFLFSRKKFAISRSWIMLVLGFLLGKILNYLKLNLPKGDYKDITISRISSFDERFDEFWKEVSQKYPIIFLRNKDFLNWRYVQNPNYQYNIWAAEKNGKIAGFITAAIEKLNNYTVGYIVDFLTLPQEEKTAEKLIQEAVKDLKSKSADLILSTGLSKYQRRALRKNKFISNFLIQRHLRPRFFFKISGDKFGSNFLRNPENWFVSNFSYDVFM